MAEHNHLTRDIKPLWSGCHGCDEYHVNALQMRIAALLAERDAARAEVRALLTIRATLEGEIARLASEVAALRSGERRQRWAGVWERDIRREALADLREQVLMLEHDDSCSEIRQEAPCDCLRGSVLDLIEEEVPHG